MKYEKIHKAVRQNAENQNCKKLLKLIDLADSYNLKVIYDAAHVFGVKIGERGIGSYGDISMFSFHATKVFNTIEGGGISYNCDFYERQLNLLKNFGIQT